MTSRGTKSFSALNREVIDHGLCSGCGTCVGVCLAGAIDFNDNRSYPEVVDEQKCQACGMCARVCPGKGVSLNAIAAESKTPAQEFNVDVGNYIRFLIGYSTDAHVRSKSSSGGVAISLLLYALENRIVDKVIVVLNDDTSFAKPVFKITDSRADILESMQSKYIQVPLNKAIKTMLQSDGRYAVVGLPCHIEGLFKAQKEYKGLSRKIVFKIGLFCGYSYAYECTETILKRIGLRRNEVGTFLGWREGDGYPGFFSLTNKDGRIFNLSYIAEHNINVANFALFRCFLCIDGLNELADVSIGDTPDQPKNNGFIISRSETGDELLKAAKNANYINCTTAEPIISLKNGILPFMIKEKRLKVSHVLAHLSRKSIPVPDWEIIPGPIAQADRINAILRIELVRFIRTKLIADFLKSHPRLMESVGGRVYRLDVDPKRAFYPFIIKYLQSHPKFAAKARAIRNQSLDLPKKLRLLWHRYP